VPLKNTLAGFEGPFRGWEKTGEGRKGGRRKGIKRMGEPPEIFFLLWP